MDRARGGESRRVVSPRMAISGSRASLLGFLCERVRADETQGIARGGAGGESRAAEFCEAAAPGAGGLESSSSVAFAGKQIFLCDFKAGAAAVDRDARGALLFEQGE